MVGEAGREMASAAEILAHAPADWENNQGNISDCLRVLQYKLPSLRGERRRLKRVTTSKHRVFWMLTEK